MLAAGVLHTAAFAPTYLWPLQILALALLAWVVGSSTPRRAAWLGGCFSFGWLVSGLWWLYISMHQFGDLPAVMAAAAVLLLAAALSVYPALALALYARLRSGRPLADGLLFAACWLLAELARGQCFTGFPWIASGYAHSSGPLATLAPWIGVYGIGACAALIAYALAAAWQPAGRSKALPALAVGLPLAAFLAPAGFTTSSGELRVSLLQPNVAQDLKFDPQQMSQNMATLLDQLRLAQGDLVLTPESVVPVTQADLDPAYWAALIQPFSEGQRSALIGTFLGNEAEGYVNSLVGVSAAQQARHGDLYHYGKRHLLPFGEYMPPGLHWFVELMKIPLGDQASGHNEAPFEVGTQRVRPLICYEDLFGEDFAASVVGPEAATVLVNASNLAWFGRHMIQAQHLQFSRMRAMEFRRPQVRATNTGATAVIDHLGNVTARLPPDVEGELDASVEGRIGDTPYAIWMSQWRLWPLWGLALALLLVGLLVPRKH